MKYKKLGFLYICLWFVVAGSFADSVEPEEPGIVLPPVFLDIEDLSEETIDAVLPEFDPKILPEPTLQLPDAGELLLSDDIFDVEPPDQAGRLLADPSSAAGASLFSEGTIGLGTQNSLIGDLSLYKLGPEPRFTMSFLHDSVDGYGSRSGGTNFYRAEDALDGTFEFNREQFVIGFEAELREREEGLQDIGSYSSISHRFLSGAVGASFSPARRVTLAMDVGVSSATQVLAAVTPRIASEIAIAPELNIQATLGILTMSLSTSYGLGVSDILSSALHSADAEAGLLFEFLFGLDFGIRGGSTWDTEGGFVFPFGITLDGTLGRVLGFRLEGGYSHNRVSLFDMWQSYQFADVPTFAAEYGWYAGVDLQWSFWDSLVLGTGGQFSSMEQVLVRGDTPDGITGLFNVSTDNDRMFFSPEIELTWRPTETFSFAASWAAEMFAATGFTPDLLIALEGIYEATGDRYGVSAGMSVASYGSVPTPDVYVSGFYRIAEGVTIDMEVKDVLAFMSADERTTWGPYVSPGFRVLLATRISL